MGSKRKQPRPWEIKPDPAVMNPVNVMNRLKEGDQADIRKEYTRLRDIAQKRIKRGGLDVKIPKLRELANNSELAKNFAFLNRFIASETSTEAGRKRIRQREVETLERHQFSGINTKNVGDFNRFMSWYREKYTAELPTGRLMVIDSDTVVAAFREVNDRISQETKNRTISRIFNEWMEEQGDFDVTEINREARNAKNREKRYKKRKQQQGE